MNFAYHESELLDTVKSFNGVQVIDLWHQFEFSNILTIDTRRGLTKGLA